MCCESTRILHFYPVKGVHNQHPHTCRDPAMPRAPGDVCLAARSLNRILGDPSPVLGTQEGLGGMVTRDTWTGKV